MTSHPEWLPPLVRLADYGGDWNAYLEAVYQYFAADFVRARPTFFNKPVGLKRHPMLAGKEAAFWHVTSEGREETERTPDLRRCERVRWLRPVIEHYDDSGVRCWPNRRGQDRRAVLWLYDYDFVVVLAQRGRYYLLWTAYCVSSEHAKMKLRKEYEEYRKKQAPPE